MTQTKDQLREVVRQKYAEIVGSDGAGCCAPSSCREPVLEPGQYSDLMGDAYKNIEGYVAEADLGLGCGLPVEHAALKPGHTVLDLGSGAGLDAFVARQEVGGQGHVIGVDMTAEMIARSRKNVTESNFSNVEFRLGEIEHLPVLSDSVDVVISNCVLNLVPDKERAFAEIFRVLKPGGHFCISDIVSSEQLPAWLSEIAEAYAGCVAGALPKDVYLQTINQAGFEQIEIAEERRIDVPTELLSATLSMDQREEVLGKNLHVMSITVTARKP